MTVHRYIPIADIRRRPDARPIDETTVAALTESIREIGLRTPINVRVVDDGFELIAGSHRLAACERLGETEILACQAVDDDLHAELAMIDENLCRAELSPVDRAQQTARRKAIYELLHPQTRHGGDRRSDQVANLATRSFAAATAAATGQSDRAVRREAERGEKIVPEALSMLKNTPLATGAYLDKIKNLTPDDQVTEVKQALAQPMAAQRPVANVASVTEPGITPKMDYYKARKLLDELGGISAPDLIASCPAKERAALCSRLAHLMDVFHRILEGVAP